MIADTGPWPDRQVAGAALGRALRGLDLADPVVLALSRGGVPVGREVADALEAPLDVLVVRKVGVPGQPELALGAVTAAGTTAWTGGLWGRLGLREAGRAELVQGPRAEAEERDRRYREVRPREPLGGRTAIVVDDGLATGTTMVAAVREARTRGASRVVVAVPVGSAEAIERLEAEADAVVCLRVPRDFWAVGQFYARFPQVSDDEVLVLLAAPARA